MGRLPRALALAACLVAARASAAAPTFVVDSLLDVPGGGDLTDGVCETATGNGVCTLRAAVMEANGTPGGDATIRLPAGTYLLLQPHVAFGGAEEGDLDLAAPLTIEGAGPGATIVDGNDLDRVFLVRTPGAVLRGLTITNGKAPLQEGGGGIATGIATSSTLENVSVTGNEAAYGGGILNEGELVLRRCSVEDNLGDFGGGGIYSSFEARISDASIRRNRAPAATGGGGGGVFDFGSLRIERTLIAENEAQFGAGLAVLGESQVVVVNSTLHDNRGGVGAGVYVEAGTTQLVHVTVSDNRKTLPTPPDSGAGLYVEAEGTLLLRNSVVAGNRLEGIGGSVPSECGAPGLPILSGDYNLIGFRASCFLTGALTHVNAAEVDAQLQPLAPNGGFAPDRAGGGPTIAAVPAASCTDDLGAPLREDQRGYTRAGACDIGAHQVSGRYAPEVLLGVELIRNGGAEGDEVGATDGFELVPPPYWAAPDAPVTQITYGLPGGFPLASEAPPHSGSHFFEGGHAAVARGFQGIDLSALAAQIDAQAVGYTVSGAFGGLLAEDDHASLILLFTNDSDVFEVVTIGGFDAADRQGLTGLLPDAAHGVVPAGARFVNATLEIIRVDGVRNNGTADDLSLVLPEPSAAQLGGLAILALGGLRLAAAR